KLMTWPQVLVDPPLVIRQLFATRVQLPTCLNKAPPFKPECLLLMQLLVPLKRQRVGQNSLTILKVAPKFDSDESLLVIKHMSAHIVRAAERGIATFYRTRQSLAGLDLPAPQLVSSKTPMCAKGFFAPFDRTVQRDARIPLGMDLQVILAALGRRQNLTAPWPGAWVLETDQTALMLDSMA
ncbi:hypothetical protein BGZ54_003792, partial [Gamsiella multidivaricata]